MKKIAILLFLLAIIVLILLTNDNRPDNAHEQSSPEHIYASWDTMEYDKCVAIWLIKRYYDNDAQFIFYPKDTEIAEETFFDVPGATWSRQHRKCTSDCILEELKMADPTVIKIVKMAHDVELNFWQLDAFPEAQNSYQEVMAMLNQQRTGMEFVEEVLKYFDQLYRTMNDNIEE